MGAQPHHLKLHCDVIPHEIPHNARKGCVPALWTARLPSLSHTTPYKDSRSGRKDSLTSIHQDRATLIQRNLESTIRRDHLTMSDNWKTTQTTEAPRPVDRLEILESIDKARPPSQGPDTRSRYLKHDELDILTQVCFIPPVVVFPLSSSLLSI